MKLHRFQTSFAKTPSFLRFWKKTVRCVRHRKQNSLHWKCESYEKRKYLERLRKRGKDILMKRLHFQSFRKDGEH